MKKTVYISVTLSVLGILLFSCSTKKNSFINRNFHSVTTKYNVLFNGNVAFEEGREALMNSFIDNYWEVLPVERMEVQDELAIPGQGGRNPSFKKAEEKAVKAIQKHSMDIKGRQRNPQMDEAYLLLGKARYFDQRFIPALEALNYTLAQYPDSDKINQTRIWREKTHLRLENEEFAIANLKELIRFEKLDDQEYADANAVLGQAYINLKHKDSAVQVMKRAASSTEIHEEEGRYNYIIGQLFNELGHKDSANMAFDKVIALNRKSPRIYMINAHVEKARNFDLENGNKEEFLEMLNDLAEDRENRPFLGRIYRQLAEYHLAQDSLVLAESYFNQSVRKAKTDKQLKALDYENIAALRFDEAQYKDAGMYYDSTLLNLKKNTRKFRRIEKKRANLEDVIAYEDVAKQNDSILKLVNFSEEERTTYFQEYIDVLKAEEAAQLEAEEQKQNFAANEFASSRDIGPKTGGDEFYFYNQTTVAYGKNEFRKRWGDRALEDNWRLFDKNTVVKTTKAEDNATADAGTKDIYSVAFYTDKIPTEEKVIDSIGKERNFAYYQLGLIYKEKFKEYELAANRLEQLLENNPEEKLILPSKYNLYKIYVLLEQPSKADQYKNDILSNHGDSRYAQILRNPQDVLATDENSPESLYANTYKKFVNQEFEQALVASDKYILQFTGEEIVPKFEMLKAIIIARLDGYVAYKEALNYVALNYPNDEEGKRAQEIIATSLPKLNSKVMVKDDKSTNFKVIYTFEKNETEAMEALEKTIAQAFEDKGYNSLSISQDVYNRSQRFIVIHGFNSKAAAYTFEYMLETGEKYLVEKENVIMSSENYQIVQIHKNLDEVK
ncbi:type IX secretion system periplasmic lipoprotein PorW/SprE [Kordia aestuariivivens]|uniref:type IX secretion system periplasmic lipoprotein PorW/SprE n=1 Tax=Kordia aestuariivivens TaxID=2759037 RepID=UPI001F1575ED|nr:tetratricopeptide repeat protein [Kordia aestuariivivens]